MDNNDIVVSISASVNEASIKDSVNKLEKSFSDTSKTIGNDLSNIDTSKLNSNVKKSLDKIDSDTKETASSMSSTFTSMFAALSAANIVENALGGIKGFLSDSIKEAAEAEVGLSRLKSTLESIGRVGSFEKIKDEADELKDKFAVDDDAILKMRGSFEKFGGIGEDQMKGLEEVTINYARQTGKSMEQATDDILKGLNGQGRAFKELGLNMEASHNKAKNLSFIMTDLSDKVKGAGDAYASTAQGGMDKFAIAMSDLRKEIGANLLPIIKEMGKLVVPLIDGLKSAVHFVGDVVEGYKMVFGHHKTLQELMAEHKKTQADNLALEADQKAKAAEDDKKNKAEQDKLDKAESDKKAKMAKEAADKAAAARKKALEDKLKDIKAETELSIESTKEGTEARINSENEATKSLINFYETQKEGHKKKYLEMGMTENEYQLMKTKMLKKNAEDEKKYNEKKLSDIIEGKKIEMDALVDSEKHIGKKEFDTRIQTLKDINKVKNDFIISERDRDLANVEEGSQAELNIKNKYNNEILSNEATLNDSIKSINDERLKDFTEKKKLELEKTIRLKETEIKNLTDIETKLNVFQVDKKVETLNKIRDTEIQAAKDKMDLELLNTELTESARADIIAKYNDQVKEYEKKTQDEIVRMRYESYQKGIDAASGFTNAISSLSDSVSEIQIGNLKKGSDAEKKAQKEAFNRHKALSLVITGINIAKSIMSIMAEYPKFDGGIAMTAALVTAAVTGAAQIATIASKQYSDTSSSSSSSTSPTPTSTPSSSVPNPNMSMNAGRMDIKPQNKELEYQKVYVLESDITRTQNRVNVLESRATLK